jgi:aromatic-L-amino-acid/L-tryptophan decarboxylase
MGPEEFRAAGHELVDWIADYRARIPQLPVQAQVGPGEVAGKLAGRAPEVPNRSVRYWPTWRRSWSPA